MSDAVFNIVDSDVFSKGLADRILKNHSVDVNRSIFHDIVKEAVEAIVFNHPE